MHVSLHAHAAGPPYASPHAMAFLRPLIQLICSHILRVLLLLARASVPFDAAA